MIYSPSFCNKSGNFFEHEGKINPRGPGAKLDAVIQGGGKKSVWATLPK